MKKGITAAVLACSLMVPAVLSGCGQQQSPDNGGQSAGNSPAPNTGNEKIEMRLSWWGSEARHNSTLEAIKLYEEANPNVKIVPEYQGWDGYKSKLIAQVMAGNAPDIYSTITEWFPELVQADGMADLTGKVDVSGHNPQYVEASSMDGKMYGVNLSVNGMVLIQNNSLLEELGVAPLGNIYTWDDLVNKFQEVSDKSAGKVYGAPDFTANVDGMGFDLFKYYGYSKLGVQGAFPFDNDNYTFTKDQIQDYLQFFADLRETKAVAPPELSAINDFSANSMLIKRMAAYEINYAGTFERFQEQTQDNLTMVPLPVGPNGEVGDLSRPGLLFTVFQKSPHIDQATDFIDFFTNTPEAAAVLKNSRGVLPTTVQRNALIQSEDLLSDTDKKVMAIVDDILMRELKLSYAGPIGNSELQLILPEISQKIAFNKATVEEGAEEFMKQVEKLAK